MKPTRADVRAAGLTIAAAAQRLGISPGYLRSVLAGRRQGSPQLRQDLAALLRAPARAVTLSVRVGSQRVYVAGGNQLTPEQRHALLRRMHRWLTLELARERNQRQADARAKPDGGIPF